MTNKELMEYPSLPSDPALDFEASKIFFGRGSCVYGIEEKVLSSGETVVYLAQQIEGDEIIDTPRGFGRICKQRIIICGYKVEPSGFFKIFKSKKIELILDDERKKVISELLRSGLELKINEITFWN